LSWFKWGLVVLSISSFEPSREYGPGQRLILRPIFVSLDNQLQVSFAGLNKKAGKKWQPNWQGSE